MPTPGLLFRTRRGPVGVGADGRPGRAVNRTTGHRPTEYCRAMTAAFAGTCPEHPCRVRSAAATVVSPRLDHIQRSICWSLRSWTTSNTSDGHLEQCGRSLGRQRQVAQFVAYNVSRTGVEPHRGCPPTPDRGPVTTGREVGGVGEIRAGVSPPGGWVSLTV